MSRAGKPYRALVYWRLSSARFPFPVPSAPTARSAERGTRRTSAWVWPPRPGARTRWSPKSRWNWATVPRICACWRTRSERSWTDRQTCWPPRQVRQTTRRLWQKTVVVSHYRRLETYMYVYFTGKQILRVWRTTQRRLYMGVIGRSTHSPESRQNLR